MNNLGRLITSPAWWVTAVIVAFLVNMLAAYAKPVVDRIVATWSTNRQNRLQAGRQRDEATVMYLLENPERLVDLRTDATYTALRVILALSFAIFWTGLFRFADRYLGLDLLSDILLGCIYFYQMVIALRHFRRFHGLRRVIDKCTKAVYSYDEMPFDVVESLRRSERNL